MFFNTFRLVKKLTFDVKYYRLAFLEAVNMTLVKLIEWCIILSYICDINWLIRATWHMCSTEWMELIHLIITHCNLMHKYLQSFIKMLFNNPCLREPVRMAQVCLNLNLSCCDGVIWILIMLCVFAFLNLFAYVNKLCWTV